jgi:peptidoglycan/xylan/chitin deacetylase (PgdA/CDA1 family)
MSLIGSLIFFQPLSSVFSQTGTQGNPRISCDCIVFRMDDVQDSFVDVSQVTAMNIFISKGQPLSLGLIMNYIGNDSKILGKIEEGSKRGLFELGLHGWDHINYTKLSDSEQRETLDMANKKMKRIFGNISQIFAPPYGYFNNNTLEAMNDLGISILSSTIYSENKFDKGRSIFNNSAELAQDLDDVSERVNNNISFADSLPFHVPGLVFYKEYENGRPIKNPVSNIMDSVDDNIGKYGYSVIVFHPQDFAYADANGRIANKNGLNTTEIKEFSQVIDTLLSKNRRITTLSEIVGDNKE